MRHGAEPLDQLGGHALPRALVCGVASEKRSQTTQLPASSAGRITRAT